MLVPLKEDIAFIIALIIITVIIITVSLAHAVYFNVVQFPFSNFYCVKDNIIPIKVVCVLTYQN